MVEKTLNQDFLNYLLDIFSESTIKDCIDLYNQPHRFYHNLTHINRLYELSYQLYPNLLEQDREMLLLSIFFHDLIYKIGPYDNEEESANYLDIFNIRNKKIIQDAILNTKNHLLNTNNNISNMLARIDMYDLVENTDLQLLITNEKSIFKEYQKYSSSLYKTERIKFLEKTLEQYPNNKNLLFLIDYVSSVKRNIAIFAGSFNPFHIGHLNIVEKANNIFDKVIIAQGRNPKKSHIEVEEFNQNVKERFEVVNYNGLLSDFIGGLPDDNNYTLIRGLRNTTDLQYEITQIQFIKDLYKEKYKKELNVTYIICDKEYEHISSTAVRELSVYNQHHKYIP